ATAPDGPVNRVKRRRHCRITLGALLSRLASYSSPTRASIMTESVIQVDVPDPKRLIAVLQFLAELGQVVASNTEMQPILDWIVSKTTAMLGADEGSIRLVDPGPDAA